MKKKITIYKLNAQKYPKLAEKLKVKKFPSLILYKDKKENFRYEGLLKERDIKDVNRKIKKVLTVN